MKKLIVCIFSIMILLTFTVVVSATSNEDAFAAGDGTAENPYQVATAEQLNAVRNNLSAHYIQIQDIDLSQYGNWTPIGTEAFPFNGRFDGNGYLIKNITIDVKSNKYNVNQTKDVGLFGYAYNAYIQNMGIENAYYHISTEYYFNDSSAYFSMSGGIAGTIKDTYITNCYFKGYITHITAKGWYCRTAGIAALAINSNIVNCYSDIDILSVAYDMNTMSAGLVAWLDSSTIDKCYAVGKINGTNDISYCYVGGANASSNQNNCNVKNCVIALDELVAGGKYKVINQIGNYSDIINTISLESNSSKRNIKSTYTELGWDFSSTWIINNSLPTLRVFEKDNKSFEKYFADNIGGYIDQITGLKLPYDYLGEQADAKGITFWSLFYNQLNESNLLGADTLIEGKFFYETILLQIVSNEVRSNEYIESLKGQVLDVATSAISSAVTNQKLSVLQKKKTLEYSDYKTICKELELLTGIRTGIDVSEQLYKTAKNFDDVVKMWCEYNVAAKASTEIYLALEETAKECEDSYLRNALYSVADKYKMSISRTFQEAYGNKTADILITTITKAAVGELLDGYGINALSAARLFFDTAELTTNVIYPLSNTTESICFIKSVQTLESYVKLALYNSVSEYNTNKTYENAQKVVGLYDLLMKVYDYGMNESKLYAEYHYNTGLFNGIYNVFSNNNQIEYEDTISWINSYNGALNDVKWYRTKAEIEYGFETGTLVPVVVNTYFAGKVVDSVADIISNGSIYNPPAGGTLNLPTFFHDITLSVTTSGYYYDSAFTKPYVATNLTTPVTLYKQVTIQRHPRVVVNGQEVTFPDQKPILEDGRTLVPARGVFEALGATVSWNGNTNTATIRTNSKDITITIGQKYIVVNAKRIPIDVPAKIINGRTMIPLRAVAEALECEVGWDGATYVAIIEN